MSEVVVVFPRSLIVLVAIQNEGQRRMTSAAYSALRRLGARNPLNAAYRGSFALIGYTGPGRPSFVRQVKIITVLWELGLLSKSIEEL